MKQFWVRESDRLDVDGKAMLYIGPGLFPQDQARQVMAELQQYFASRDGPASSDN